MEVSCTCGMSVSLCAKHFATGGGDTIATTGGHKQPTPPLPFLFFFEGKLTRERFGCAMSEASRTPITIRPNTRTRQRFHRTRNRELETHRRTRATPRTHARSTCENATLARLPERDARTLRERHTQPTRTQPPETPPRTTDYTYRHTGNADAPRDRTRTTVAPRPSSSHDRTRPRVHTNTSQTIQKRAATSTNEHTSRRAHPQPQCRAAPSRH